MNKRLHPLLLFASILMLVLPMTAGAQAQPMLSHQAGAFGSYVFVGNTVTLGRTAQSAIACGSQPGAHSENTTASVGLPPILDVGGTDTTADALNTPAGGTAAQGTSTVGAVSLLGGLITVDAVKAVSTSLRNATGFQTSARGSTLANLRVLGLPIPLNPSPNTQQIDLPGVGHVVLNERIRKVTPTSASLQVNMIHVMITGLNLTGLPLPPLPLPLPPLGTEIIIGHADSKVQGFFTGLLDGFAYGSRVAVGPLVTSAETALLGLPCVGTKGNVKTRSVAGVNLLGLLSIQGVTSTAQGTASQNEVSGKTTSTIATVNIPGVLQTGLIKADARSSIVGGAVILEDFSSLEGLTLAVPVPGLPNVVPPNTQIPLLGLGTLWLHRVIETPTSIEIRMVDLYVLEANNLLGLPVGVNIRLGVAKAGVRL
ncbi:MAG: choice-of-anchor P family protein [Methylococcales bacterium]